MHITEWEYFIVTVVSVGFYPDGRTWPKQLLANVQQRL